MNGFALSTCDGAVLRGEKVLDLGTLDGRLDLKTLCARACAETGDTRKEGIVTTRGVGLRGRNAPPCRSWCPTATEAKLFHCPVRSFRGSLHPLGTASKFLP